MVQHVKVRTRNETPLHLTDSTESNFRPIPPNLLIAMYAQYLATGGKSQDAKYSEFHSWQLAVQQCNNPGHRWESESFAIKSSK